METPIDGEVWNFQSWYLGGKKRKEKEKKSGNGSRLKTLTAPTLLTFSSKN